jgi:hypothetical protein
MEYKLAAYQYYIESVLTVPLTTHRQHNEWKTILPIAQKVDQYPSPRTHNQSICIQVGGGRKWFQEVFDGNDLKPRKYPIRMTSYSCAISGEVGCTELLHVAEIEFLYADLFVWKIFCKILSFEQPCDQYSYVKVTICYRYNILRLVLILNIRKQ